MRLSAAVMAAALVPNLAHAFCGTYVSGAGAEMYNHGSSVILARNGQQTTLTLANDFAGSVSDFALVIPIPHVLGPEDVRTVDPALFETVDLYSGPRVVEYTCEDIARQWHEQRSFNPSIGCADYALAFDADGGTLDQSVTVEAQFDVSEYDVSILSATGGEGLEAWLAANGYEMPAGSAEMLQSYVDGGSYFLAAKVDLGVLLGEGERTWLSPLVFTYTSEVLSLPIRIGTLSSDGTQDLTIYVVNALEDGEVGIANYPKVTIEDECLWDGDDFAADYDRMIEEALDGGDRAGWLVEYSWRQAPNLSHCDPCVTLPDDPGSTIALDLAQMGYGVDISQMGEDTGPSDTGSWMGSNQTAHFTRIHMRYRPEQVDEDIVFYSTGIQENSQIRFVDHVPELEFAFPVCGEGFVANPGRCDNIPLEREARGGCNVQAVLPMTWLTVLMGLIAGLSRRRSS